MIFTRLLPAIICFLVFANEMAAQQEPQREPVTVAESSDYKSTSTSQQVVEFVESCASKGDHIQKFVFGKTVEGRDMVGVSISSAPYEPGDTTDKAVVLVIGNIHSGECAGKEALLMLMRDLGDAVDHRWLKNLVVILVPNYNADANDRMGKFNRPGQIGPENGMGRRENAQNLDLNRDFVKLESPEARALVKLIDTVNPHLFIDCHTTNGSKHQYALTYDIPHNPATAQPIREFLRERMMPEVTTKLADDDTLTFYYGNFNQEHTKWTTFGHEPRYSTEYVGLRGRFAILSEAYSYIPYKDRIVATKDFVTACLDYVHQNAGAMKKVLAAVDSDLERAAKKEPERIQMSLAAKAVAFDQKFPVKGFKDDQPHDYQCDFIGKYETIRSVQLPFAYLIPASFSRQVDRMLMHGITVQQLAKEHEFEVTIQRVAELNRNERTFQKHRMVQAESEKRQERVKFEKGTFVVRTSQPLGRLASYILECDSNDGFVFWNFFDDDIAKGMDYPVTRMDKPQNLSVEKVAAVTATEKVTLEMIGAVNSPWQSPSAPRWKTGNQIEMRLSGRKFLMDAQSMSFASTLEPKFEKQKLVGKLVDAGVEEDVAKAVIKKSPLESEDRSHLVFDGAKVDFLYNVEDDSVQIFGNSQNNAELFEFSPDQSKCAFVNLDGLNIFDAASGEVVTVKATGGDDLIGKLDWVYQEELYGRGNFKGYWWSPDSKHIAFLRLDEAEVATFTITDHIPVRGEDEFLNYPKAGDANPLVQVGIVSASSASDVNYLDLSRYESEEILVSNVDWKPDSESIVLQVQNREQTWLDLVGASPEDPSINVLFRDKTEAWITSPGNPFWLSDNRFLWLSPRNGYRHIYVYASSGQLEKQLTQGNWEVRSIKSFDKKNGVVYFSAAKENAYEIQAYRLEVESGEATRITEGAGTHSVSFNKDSSLFIDSVSTFTQPPQHRLCRCDGTVLRSLEVSSDDRSKYFKLTEPEFFEIPSSNDQPLDALVIRPPNFDPTQKYPVLIYAYAGPQSPRVRNRWDSKWGLWHQALANQGYVIFKCDNQSASYRSSKHVWPIHEDLGRNELADIERGVAWLKQQPWIDGDRIGIWGWSYGGYMTAYALTHSQSFKVGISGAPVTDWRNYDTIYTERLMGLPTKNEKGYQVSSVLKSAANLHGKLLLIHGSIDDNVHLSNSMQFALELQKAGKQFELMIYPQNRHSIRASAQAAHLRKLMFDFIKNSL